MCGITAFLGSTKGAKYVLEGIKMLRNRGYDSMGCSSISRPTPSDEIQFTVSKFANRPDRDSFDLFQEDFHDLHGRSQNLMAHCRWATTGMVNDPNSHPHLDTLTLPSTISVVHNGIISNYQKLKDFLLSKGVTFNSDTDTEVIVNLISYYLHNPPPQQGPNQSQTITTMDAIKLTIKELEGTWALIIQNRLEPNNLYVCKKGSPILVGYSPDMCIVSSETTGFSNYLKSYHVVQDHQILKITYTAEPSNDQHIRFFRDERLTELSTHTIIHQELHATSPDPFPHWTLKEIMEQPESASRALSQGGRIKDKYHVKLGGLNDHTKELLNIQHLTIIASGTSYHAGLVGQKYLRTLSPTFQTIRVIDSSEFNVHHDLTPKNAGVLLLSQSGETRDVINCMEQIRADRPDTLIFSIVNVVESLIAREADCGIYLNSGREVGVASTKTFTNQCIVLILLSVWFAQHRHQNRHLRAKIIRSLHNIESLITQTLLKMQPVCQSIIPLLTSHQHLFILGRDRGLPVAQEGSLKIKEISYIHAEAYPAGGLKHGPLALISEGTPVIVIRIGDHEDLSRLDIAAEETKSRGAYLISITPFSSQTSETAKIYDREICIPDDPHLSPILANIPLQYIAYLLSVALGYNSDFPKNLRK